jgi:hypothetical protein
MTLVHNSFSFSPRLRLPARYTYYLWSLSAARKGNGRVPIYKHADINLNYALNQAWTEQFGDTYTAMHINLDLCVLSLFTCYSLRIVLDFIIQSTCLHHSTINE